MIHYKFVNKDPDAIRDLLSKIGKVRFEKSLEALNISRPMKVQNFKLVDAGRVFHLEYKMGRDYHRVLILKYNEIPKKGWEIEEYSA